MDGLYVGNGYRIKRWDTYKARQNNDGDTFAVSGNTTVGNVSKESGKVDSGETNLLGIFEYCAGTKEKGFRRRGGDRYGSYCPAGWLESACYDGEYRRDVDNDEHEDFRAYRDAK